jgi:outer membrane protein TolC
MASVRRLLRWAGVAVGVATAGCSIAPPREQVSQVNDLVNQRTEGKFEASALLQGGTAAEPPSGTLTVEEATGRALRSNLSLVAASENLTLAHGQLIQAGLIQNPTLGQSSGWLFPVSPGVAPSFDINISQVLNSIFTRPGRVAVAQVQELQANIDLASLAFALVQQVDGKYQEAVHLARSRQLAERVAALYGRAVQAAEARRRVGIIPTPELNRARLSYEDARRQVQHLASQYRRAAQELNWLMGYSTAPRWTLPPQSLTPPNGVETLPDDNRLESMARDYRMDLLRARLDRRMADKGVELARVGLIPQTTLGLEFARDSSKNAFIGPFFNIVIPIFDPGLVALQLAEAQARKANKTYAALEGQVRQDVRTAADNFKIAADDVSFYQDRILPQQEENVKLMETSFELGNDDLDSLLNVYQSYVQQLQGYEDSLRAYHDSAVAMQQAVGVGWRRLGAASTSPATRPGTDTRPGPVTQPLPDTRPNSGVLPTFEPALSSHALSPPMKVPVPATPSDIWEPHQ